MVLEKCWAKLLGSYKKTNWGYTSEAFQALTGAPTVFRLVSSFMTFDDPKSMHLFELLKMSDERHYVTEVSIGKKNEKQETRL